MLQLALCLLTTGFVSRAQVTPPTLPKEIAALGFLVGNWTGAGGGAPGQGAGDFAFKVELQGKVIVRTSSADYPATANSPATHHDDLIVISADGGKARADYFDSEGHVIRYAVEVPAPNTAVLLSDASASAPQYRLKYVLDSTGLLTGSFELAPPGSGGKFQLYLSWTAKKR